MAPTSPLVQGDLLTCWQNGQVVQVMVGSTEWFRWLETASTFTYRSEHGTFTARLEQAGNKRGGMYWRAYRKRAGKLHRVYLGKPAELTLERLQMVAVLLTGQRSAEAEPNAVPEQRIGLLKPLEGPAPHSPSERSLPTGTITLLLTDIEGSTRLLQQLGKHYADVLTVCRHILRTVFQQLHGHEVDTQGDAFFAVFARATDAVFAAVAAQRALINHSWPEGVIVRVRMGLHTGEPQGVPEGYVGLDVHRAAHIMSAGYGGRCCSRRRPANWWNTACRPASRYGIWGNTF